MSLTRPHHPRARTPRFRMRGVLPRGIEYRQSSAHASIAARLCLACGSNAGRVTLVAGVLSPEVLTLRRSCRPSPWGRSCTGVHGSPSFSVEHSILAVFGADGRGFADGVWRRCNRFDAARLVTFYGVDFSCDLTRGHPICKDFEHISCRVALLRPLAFWRLALWWPVVTRFQSRRLSVAVRALLQLRWLAAASSPVPQLGPQATWSFVRPIRTAADDLRPNRSASGLPAIQDQLFKTTGAFRAGGFLVVPEEIRRAA